MQARLERSTTNRVIGGVCGGIGEYLQVDATLVRVFFVIAGFLTAGLGILGYIALLVLMPLPGQPAPFVQGAPAPNADATPGAAEGASEADATAPIRPMTTATPRDPAAEERRRAMFGYFLVALGALFLLANLGVFRIVRWDLIWPLVLIGGGVLLLAQRVRR